ncbi:MAG: glutaredoxin [Thiomonas sp. 20-64-9]|jgi:thioredoxin-related protein|uniref:thioredoxin fold domain-containing protein n=1 Tax=unclassified Thiomonas TaxID=2625466 RepID=UPI000BC559D5|nr:thioredoxin fold domain-containing protein [Thiomonas sp. 13-64-67]OYV30651.1 MAG: glutaredoxin [Thiomonas sp. 20-64-9]OZB70185.1 MAG: glutaredoxin [Thiomonas sp. 13-64-67]
MSKMKVFSLKETQGRPKFPCPPRGPGWVQSSPGGAQCDLREGFVALNQQWRQFLRLVSLLLLSLTAGVAWAETPLPPVQNLQQSALQAAAKDQPLIVMFSLPNCPFCEKLRRTQYQFMAKEGYVVQQIEITSRTPVTGFDGKPTTGVQLARQFGIRLAPTVLFFGPGGKEIGERITGAPTADFYGAFIDRALKESAQALKAKPGAA